jgi:signal transduction histidine kinase
MEPVDLSDVALDVVERLVPLAQRDGVTLINGDLPEVCAPGDRQFLTQMLTNLVENAIKYAGGAGKHVWVDTGFGESGSKALEENPYVWVRVIDDGPGISPEHQSHIFDRFYRVDQSRTRSADIEKRPSGSGLGLSIVQWIVKAHGGEVTVTSEPGKGSCFEVRLPRA